MMLKRFKVIVGFLFVIALCWISASAYAAEGVSKMTKEELKERLDRPDVIVLDVRSGRDWKSSEVKIKGAVREDPRAVASWADKYPKDKTLVLYCA